MQYLRIESVESKVRQLVSVALGEQEIDIVVDGVTEDDYIGILKQFFERGIRSLKVGRFAKFRLVVAQFYSRSVSAGSGELALWIDEYVFLLNDIQSFVGKHVAQRAYFSMPAETVGAFDIKEQIIHKFLLLLYPAILYNNVIPCFLQFSISLSLQMDG